MITTMRELREAIAEHCDFTQPLRVVAHDVGKKAAKHSVVLADENHPAYLKVTGGTYTNKGIIELSHYAEADVLMPEAALEELDRLLEERPKEGIGWAYFFYFPLDVAGFFGKVRHVACSSLDTSKIHSVYLSDEVPNTLVIEAEYDLGAFE